MIDRFEFPDIEYIIKRGEYGYAYDEEVPNVSENNLKYISDRMNEIIDELNKEKTDE